MEFQDSSALFKTGTQWTFHATPTMIATSPNDTRGRTLKRKLGSANDHFKDRTRLTIATARRNCPTVTKTFAACCSSSSSSISTLWNFSFLNPLTQVKPQRTHLNQNRIERFKCDSVHSLSFPFHPIYQ